MPISESAAKNGNDRLTPYLAGLMVLLCFATFSEGYDFFIMSLVIKRLGAEFSVDLGNVFKLVVAGVNCGAVVGFFLTRLGDTFGRKPLLIASILGFGGCSLLTAVSPNIYYYLVVQFFAKMFLVTEFGLAIIMVSEEFPAAKRGTYVAILEVAGALGGGAAMFLSSIIIPEWGWRGMYWFGGIPVLIVPVMLLYVKETQHFQMIKKGGEALRQPLMHIWSTPSKKYVVLVGLLWFLAYLSYAGVIYAWPTFAEVERNWTVQTIGVRIVAAFAVGMLGYLISGVMMDLIGRRITGAVFFLGSAVSLVWCFTAHEPYMIPSIASAMFFIFALLPICSTYNAELFPTELRANAAAWCNYLFGRPAQVAAPVVIGMIEGIGPAARTLAIGPFLAIFVVLFLLPETKGIKLDRVH
jgi:putative MFS transporter